MTPSVSAVTVIERQRQSTAILTPTYPSSATLVRIRFMQYCQLILL